MNERGLIVEEIWRGLPVYFPAVQLDQYQFMPNHFHVILVVGAPFMAPKTKAVQHQPSGVINHAPTLGEIVRRFKAISSRVLHQKGWDNFSWQRNYYEHIIRRDESLEKVRRYILENPLKWEMDEDNPENFKNDG